MNKHSSTGFDAATIAETILSTYTDNLHLLPAKERIHFVRRAYRIWGTQEFVDIITSWTGQHTIPATRRRANRLHNIVSKGDPYPVTKFKPSKNSRVNERAKLFTRRPELQFYRRYLMDMFQAYTCGLDQTLLSKQWDGYINVLQSVDFDSIYIDSQVLSKASSFAVNSVILLDTLGVDNGLHRRFVGYLKGSYFDDTLRLSERLNNNEYTSFIYNLTHIVIAYSGFYQRWVTQQAWIGQYFAENMETILKRCSFDVIAEVGLCLKLLQQEDKYSSEYEMVVSHLVEYYPFKAALSDNNISAREHTNAVLMLLFADVDQWNKGPYITKTM